MTTDRTVLLLPGVQARVVEKHHCLWVPRQTMCLGADISFVPIGPCRTHHSHVISLGRHFVVERGVVSRRNWFPMAR
jgi:hypothetical protein